MTPAQALWQLSALAADFKIGIVDDDFVREMLSVIVGSMDVNDRDEILARALRHWGIE